VGRAKVIAPSEGRLATWPPAWLGRRANFQEEFMARRCLFTGKRPNVAHQVSHSNIKTKKRQLPNLQLRRLWYEKEGRFVTLRLSTRALRTLRNKTLDEYAREVGLDLSQA
jgi:large subunit ribosomal protein L28